LIDGCDEYKGTNLLSFNALFDIFFAAWPRKRLQIDGYSQEKTPKILWDIEKNIKFALIERILTTKISFIL
jgi:hypothetical protein